jgi:hypothetical protein
MTNPLITELTFPGVIPGNNGPKGLLRMHFQKRKQLKERYIFYVRSLTSNRHTGPIRLELIRYSIRPVMDFDNLVSTGKILIDAIVLAGVLPDDNQSIIPQREYRVEKAATKNDQRTVIRIIDL